MTAGSHGFWPSHAIHARSIGAIALLAIDTDAPNVPSMSVIRLSLSLMQLALLILLLVGAATSCWSANVELVADGFQDPVAVVQPQWHSVST